MKHRTLCLEESKCHRPLQLVQGSIGATFLSMSHGPVNAPLSPPPPLTQISFLNTPTDL